MFRELIEDLRTLWDYICEGQFGDPTPPTEVVPDSLRLNKREKADTESLSLYIGKVIEDGNVKCEVVSCKGEDFRIKILEINWDRLGTYMDLGATYPLLICTNYEDFKVWEVDPDKMKRTASQVLICWEKGCGWSWDIDS
jgi:hypothetical protein